MEQLYAVFEPIPQCSIAICKTHHQGIVRSQLRGHLRKHHADLRPATRRAIVQAASHVQDWADTEEGVAFPDPSCPPLPYLKTFHDGKRCGECSSIARTNQGIQGHCKKAHGLQNKRKRGRPSCSKISEEAAAWTDGICCQKFAPGGHLGRPFEVNPNPASQDTWDDSDAGVEGLLELSLTQAERAIEEAKEGSAVRIAADENRYEWNRWLDRVGWARHLDKLDPEWLLEQTRKPEERESGLELLDEAVEMVIWKAQQASKASVVGMPAMMFINRREGGFEKKEKPFNARQTAKTMVRYSGHWMSVMRYIWRTRNLLVVGRQNIGGVQGRRPPYRLTMRQQAALRKLEEAVGEDKSEDDVFYAALEGGGVSDEAPREVDPARVEELTLEFMLSLLDHPLKDDEYESALVSGAAVLGISKENGWVSPLLYTPKLAALVNVGRMLVLLKATKMRKEQAGQLQSEGGMPAEEAMELAPSHFELVQEMVLRFMTLVEYRGKPCPVGCLQSLKAFGLKIRTETVEQGVVDWVDETLLYGNVQFDMPQLRSMIHGLVAETRQQLVGKLMLREIDDEGDVTDSVPLPTIYWDKLVDNPAEQKVGWSFMDDSRNQGATSVPEPRQWLVQQIIRTKRLRKGFIDTMQTRARLAAGEGLVAWLTGRIEQYWRDMRRFREKLLVLFHMTGGLPGRGTELVTVRWRNKTNSDSRGLFIENGLVVYVVAYHKNIGMSGKAKVIHRYLPREVGELAVYYLWFVLPFWEKLETAVQGKPGDHSDYIWEPVPEEEWARPEKKRLRANRDSHSIATEVDSGSETAEEGGEDDALVEAGERRVETWNSNRITYAMNKVTLEHMGIKLGISGWRHSTTTIYRRYVVDNSTVKAYLEADEDEEEAAEDEDEDFDAQAGHSSKVAGLIYGRPVTEGLFSTEQRRTMFRRVSLAWHAFLQMPSVLEAKPHKGTRAAAVRRGARQEQLRRWKRMRLVDTRDVLKQLVGDEAEFRGVQEPALEAIMQGHSPVVAIMGTGAGKSILFMLPASVSNGVTVVVVPLVSLREDMKDRCEKLGISCIEWQSRKPGEWAQVVLVTPESAVGAAFGQFMNRQRAMGRMDRIVVDECHVVLDSTGGWRELIMRLRNLVLYEAQLVYLTATIQPREEEQFIQLMGLPPKERCRWFRGTTTRRNIWYQVRGYDVKEEDREVKQVVDDLKEKYGPRGQIIVYCDTVGKTQRLAEVLGCVCYYRTVGSAKEKKELLNLLTSGRQQVFTATNALGLGIDAPTIRAVVHVGAIRKVRHYAQESGRAGRDGEPSEAIILRSFYSTRTGLVAIKLRNDVDEDMAEFITGTGCMRVVLDKAMDGNGVRASCEEGEMKCQRCRWREEEEVVGEELGWESEPLSQGAKCSEG